jgi:hypothetical protein
MKITLNGETFDYDQNRQPMSEALAIEKVYKRRYAQWQEELTAGSAEAYCVLAWLIWRREGRDIPYEDIIDGKVDFDFMEMLSSGAADAGTVAEAGPDPTIAAGSPDPDGIATTGTGTLPSSPASSTSARGKSDSSKSPISRP